MTEPAVSEPGPVTLQLGCYKTIHETIQDFAKAYRFTFDEAMNNIFLVLHEFLGEVEQSRRVGFVLGLELITKHLTYWGFNQRKLMRFHPLRLNQLGADIKDEVIDVTFQVSAKAASAYDRYKARYRVTDAIIVARAMLLMIFAERNELVSEYGGEEFRVFSFALSYVNGERATYYGEADNETTADLA